MRRNKSKNEEPKPSTVCIQPDHPKPVTRRDFLSYGLISGIGYVVMPSILERVFNRKIVEAVAGVKPPVLIQMHLSGGALIAHWLPPAGAGGILANGKADYASISAGSYGGLGLASQPSSATVRTDMGIPMNSTSALTTALFASSANPGGVSAAVAAKTAGAIVCLASPDDGGGSSNTDSFDRTDVGSKVLKSMINTLVLPRLLTSSGNATNSPVIGMEGFTDPSVPSLTVTSPSSLQGSVTAPFGSAFSQNGQVALANTISQLGAQYGRNVANVAQGSTYASLVQQAGAANVNLVANPPQVTLVASTGVTLPAANTTAATIWNTAVGGSNAFQAGSSIANACFNALAGYSPGAFLELPGFDYHNQTESLVTSQMQSVAECLAKILNTANAFNQPVMVAVHSNGAVDANSTGDGQFTGSGDDGTKGMMAMFYMNPSATSPTQLYANGANTAIQIGSFSPAGVVEQSSAVGGNVAGATDIIVANYLNILNQFSSYSSYSINLESAKVQNYLVFQQG